MLPIQILRLNPTAWQPEAIHVSYNLRWKVVWETVLRGLFIY